MSRLLSIVATLALVFEFVIGSPLLFDDRTNVGNTFRTKYLNPKMIPGRSRPPEGRRAVLEDPSFYRLPGETIPVEYTVTLDVDPNEEIFSGQVKIVIRATRNTDRIVLHSYSHIFQKVSLKEVGGEEFNVTYTLSNDFRFFLTIDLLEDTLTEGGLYELELIYTAPYADYLAGLYKSSYVEEDGTMRYLATTQFQSTNARDAFPCYDEPAVKAIFNVNIYVPSGYFAISNMDRIESTIPPVANRTAYSFRSSPKMSTYLLAFVVSDFDYVSNTRDGPILYPKEFRVYAKPGMKQQLQYALEFGQRSMQYLQAYADVGYRIPKMDHIAIPDFGAGAMENWGLVTYAERFLYFQKGVTDSYSEMFTGLVMSHENAHMWFGNEVSPLWWDYLWLNEGFATFFEHYATDKVFNGEWRLMEEFVVIDSHNVMYQDSLPSTNPMNNVVGHPDEIEATFNGIAYVKAGSVIRMIQHVLGEDRFRLSLSNYLKSLPTGVTEPELLYAAMQNVVQNTNLLPPMVTMSEVFGSWADQSGYPILKIARNGNNLILTQERYMQAGFPPGASKWWIPLTWTTSTNPSFTSTTARAWMNPQDANMTLAIEEDAKWYIFNLQNMGYFRVMYDDDNWKNIITALKNNITMHPLNKAQLIADIFAFTEERLLNYTILMDIISYLEVETDFLPWLAINEIITYLSNLMTASEQYPLFERLIQKIVNNAYNKVGFETPEDDSYVTKRLRTFATWVACKAKVQSCLDSASAAVAREMVDSSYQVHPDNLINAYCTALRADKTNRTVWDYMLSRYTEGRSERDQLNVLFGMGCSENDDFIDEYLAMTLNASSPLLRQDYEYAVRSVMLTGPYGVGKVLEFLQENFLEWRPNIDSPVGTYRTFVILGQFIVTEAHIDAFDTFVATYRNEFTEFENIGILTATFYIGQTLEWFDNHQAAVEGWLLSNVA